MPENLQIGALYYCSMTDRAKTRAHDLLTGDNGAAYAGLYDSIATLLPGEDFLVRLFWCDGFIYHNTPATISWTYSLVKCHLSTTFMEELTNAANATVDDDGNAIGIACESRVKWYGYRWWRCQKKLLSDSKSAFHSGRKCCVADDGKHWHTRSFFFFFFFFFFF